mmetsp:Transcript_13266/g.29746  ORF Transcript_13266/g.29746 Transcript_13266/m.29746 type:complete len:559 (-) Transcript_13266:29-1705(-)
MGVPVVPRLSFGRMKAADSGLQSPLRPAEGGLTTRALGGNKTTRALMGGAVTSRPVTGLLPQHAKVIESGMLRPSGDDPITLHKSGSAFDSFQNRAVFQKSSSSMNLKVGIKDDGALGIIQKKRITVRNVLTRDNEQEMNEVARFQANASGFLQEAAKKDGVKSWGNHRNEGGSLGGKEFYGALAMAKLLAVKNRFQADSFSEKGISFSSHLASHRLPSETPHGNRGSQTARASTAHASTRASTGASTASWEYGHRTSDQYGERRTLRSGSDHYGESRRYEDFGEPRMVTGPVVPGVFVNGSPRRQTAFISRMSASPRGRWGGDTERPKTAREKGMETARVNTASDAYLPSHASSRLHTARSGADMLLVGSWWDESDANDMQDESQRRDSEAKAKRSRPTMQSFREKGLSRQQLRHEAATKIQIAARRRLGVKYVARAMLNGSLVSVPPAMRLRVRERVQEIFRDEIPPYTLEAWRFEQPWDPFVYGSKLTLSNHRTNREGGHRHAFARMTENMDTRGVPGGSTGHEPLGSQRLWAASEHRARAAQALERTMAVAWPG